MIIGSMANWESERLQAHPALRELIDLLWRTPISEWENGQYAIQGENAYYSVVEIELRDKSGSKAEKHEVYGDIHYLLEGWETFGWAPDRGTSVKSEEYRERDLSLYDAPEGEQFFDLVPGMYIVMFPNDIHRPGIKPDVGGGTGKARKAVVKFNTRVLFG